MTFVHEERSEQEPSISLYVIKWVDSEECRSKLNNANHESGFQGFPISKQDISIDIISYRVLYSPRKKNAVCRSRWPQTVFPWSTHGKGLFFIFIIFMNFLQRSPSIVILNVWVRWLSGIWVIQRPRSSVPYGPGYTNAFYAY
jgi:hypothetical protein